MYDEEGDVDFHEIYLSQRVYGASMFHIHTYVVERNIYAKGKKEGETSGNKNVNMTKIIGARTQTQKQHTKASISSTN